MMGTKDQNNTGRLKRGGGGKQPGHHPGIWPENVYSLLITWSPRWWKDSSLQYKNTQGIKKHYHLYIQITYYFRNKTI